MSSTQVGQHAENYACRYLQKQGLTLIERNFRCRRGEIDLIMQDRNSLVFVEVRYRNNHSFGGPLMSITPAKQKRLLASVETYLQQATSRQPAAIRIDVIGMSNTDGKFQLEWIKNAIEADG